MQVQSGTDANISETRCQTEPWTTEYWTTDISDHQLSARITRGTYIAWTHQYHQNFFGEIVLNHRLVYIWTEDSI